MKLRRPMTYEELQLLKSADLQRQDDSIFDGVLPPGSVSWYGARLPDDVAHIFVVTPENNCPNCGGCWVSWSIAHGECHCDDCGYPARNYHYFFIPGKGRQLVIKLLWYHPSGVEVRR